MAVTVGTAADIEKLVSDACVLATTPPYGPTAVEVPSDMLSSYRTTSDAREIPSSTFLSRRPPHKGWWERKREGPTSPDALVQQAGGPFNAALDHVLPLEWIVISDPGICSSLASSLSAKRRVLLPKSAPVSFALPTAIGVAIYNLQSLHSSHAPFSPVVAIVDPQAFDFRT